MKKTFHLQFFTLSGQANYFGAYYILQLLKLHPLETLKTFQTPNIIGGTLAIRLDNNNNSSKNTPQKLRGFCCRNLKFSLHGTDNGGVTNDLAIEWIQ